MNLVDQISQTQLKPADKVPQFCIGDTVRVHFRIVEGDKERIQVFEGVIIARKGSEGPHATFTVRRVAFNEGVERVFPLHSPRVERVEVIREGQVRRAKLYYLRDRVGKAARVKVRQRNPEKEAAAKAVAKQAKAAAKEAKAKKKAAPAKEAKAAPEAVEEKPADE